MIPRRIDTMIELNDWNLIMFPPEPMDLDQTFRYIFNNAHRV